MRTDLNVPYMEKDQAKALGARWDGVKKTWFVVDCDDLEQFSRWFQYWQKAPTKVNKKSKGKKKLEKTTQPVCMKCGSPIAFKKLPSGKFCPTNIDGTDHWDLCSELKFKANPNRPTEAFIARTIGKDYIDTGDTSTPW